MWLVPRHSRGLSHRSPVPSVLRDALVRWYEGKGSEADHRASVVMVVKARQAEQWLACDCLGQTAPPPLMSPAFLSEAETYYLRRLTSSRRHRPEHIATCPFFREQAPQRYRETRGADAPVIDEPDGLFSVHRLAPEKLAQAPSGHEPDDRARGVAIPRLARLLWLLLERSGLNIAEQPASGERETMAAQFARMRAVAEHLLIAPGVPLARHFYTHIDPYDRLRVFARLREAEQRWPDGHAPQAFLLLYASGISGRTIALAGGRSLDLATRVDYAGTLQGPPYLVLCVVGEANARDGLTALRGYAQPIAAANRFIPVSTAAMRLAVCQLLDMQAQAARTGVDIAFKRLLFDLPTPEGLVRPDLLLEIRDRTTGEILAASVVLTGDRPSAPSAPERRKLRLLERHGRVLEVSIEALQSQGMAVLLAQRFGLEQLSAPALPSDAETARGLP